MSRIAGVSFRSAQRSGARAFCPAARGCRYIRAGNLRALGVSTATRSDALPDIPAIGEFVPGYEASGWYGLSAPWNTPPEIIERLNKETMRALPIQRCRHGLQTWAALRADDTGRFWHVHRR